MVSILQIELLEPQYSTYIYVRWPHIFSAGTATLPVPAPPPLLPWALAVWHVTGFWSEWDRLRSLGPAPAHSYRMRLLDMVSAGVADAILNRLALSPLPRTSQALCTALPLTAPDQRLYTPAMHAHYYCTSLSKRTHLGQVAATFSLSTVFFFKGQYCL